MTQNLINILTTIALVLLAIGLLISSVKIARLEKKSRQRDLEDAKREIKASQQEVLEAAERLGRVIRGRGHEDKVEL